jgi:hypothetical protein
MPQIPDFAHHVGVIRPAPLQVHQPVRHRDALALRRLLRLIESRRELGREVMLILGRLNGLVNGVA